MALALISATGAHAAASGYTTVDLNLRTGPDTGFPVVDVIPEGDEVYVKGCLRDESWCDVRWDGTRGWVYSEYIAFDYRGDYALLPDIGLSAFSIPIIAFAASDYWRRHYVGRPWYRDRYRWYRYKVRPRRGWFAPPRGIRKRGWWRKNYRAPRGVRAAPYVRRWDRPGPRARQRIRAERRFDRGLRRFDRRIERRQERRRRNLRNERRERRIERRQDRRRDVRRDRRERRIERRQDRRRDVRRGQRDRRVERRARPRNEQPRVRAERRNRAARNRAASRPSQVRPRNANRPRNPRAGNIMSGGARPGRAGRVMSGGGQRAGAGSVMSGGQRAVANRNANRRAGGQRRRNRQ